MAERQHLNGSNLNENLQVVLGDTRLEKIKGQVGEEMMLASN
jgi:hypothetical protein